MPEIRTDSWVVAIPLLILIALLVIQGIPIAKCYPAELKPDLAQSGIALVCY